MLLLDNIPVHVVAFLTLVTLYVLTVARTVTKLVPSLTEVEQCDDIPQEVSAATSNVSYITLSRSAPRREASRGK